ncbi:MAG: pyridoxamine 5'-phosphate oxidase family protein [Bacteroidales bacterium]
MRRKDRELSAPEEIESIISEADVCRIALADEGTPYIVTMNFGYSGNEGGQIWFHCANEGRKINMIRRNSRVCFEFDTGHELISGTNACDFGMNYKSVVGWGIINIVTDPGEKIKGLNHIMSHYAGNREFTYNAGTVEEVTVLRLDIFEMTGKQCCR